MALSMNMTDKEIEDYRNYFWSNDKDGDGLISKTEFSSMLKKIGLNLTAQESENLFMKTDKDKSGAITFNEFANAFLKTRKETPSLQKVKEVFMQVDKDRDGFLSRAECNTALKMLGHVMSEEGLKRVMRMSDKNKDGKVDFKEFCAFMTL